MAWTPRLTHVIKAALRIPDRAAAEGLFMEGSIEFEDGNHETARLMFWYGRRLGPDFPPNYYNYAVTLETMKGASRETIEAWEKWVEVTDPMAKVPEELKRHVKDHIAELRREGASGGTAPS